MTGDHEVTGTITAGEDRYDSPAERPVYPDRGGIDVFDSLPAH